MSAGALARTHPIESSEHVLERLQGLPGGPELLAQARAREDIALVGGAVRDLLLGHWPRELDVTVERDAAGLARALASSLSPSERPYGHPVEPTLHDRFGTASLEWEYGRIDIAERRAETYPAPGALPEVRPGSVEEDLARRDFTVNAIALVLAGPERGELRHAASALEDLEHGALRVLHEASFRDDPTRVLRLARYAARLGFEIEPQTLVLAREAVAAGALTTVSGGRIGAELWLAAAEPDPAAAFAALDELGVLDALGLPSPYDAALDAAACALLPGGTGTPIARMAVLVHPGDDDGDPSARERAAELLDRLEVAAGDRDAILAAGFGMDAVAGVLADSPRPSQVRELLAGRPLEAAALAGALAARRGPGGAEHAREWIERGRLVRLEITGEDLLAAGVPEGPEIGRRLHAVLARRLDGELAGGREAELAAALEPLA